MTVNLQQIYKTVKSTTALKGEDCRFRFYETSHDFLAYYYDLTSINKYIPKGIYIYW